MNVLSRTWLRGFVPLCLMGLLVWVAVCAFSDAAVVQAANDDAPAQASQADRRGESATQVAAVIETLDAPFLVVNVASINRMIGNLEYLFESVDRDDMADIVRGVLARARDLQGLDRDAPLGVMCYLQTGFPPTPQPIAYVPVSSVRDLTETLDLGPVALRKIPDADGDDRYELVGPRRSFQVRMQGGYAFVGNDAALLDRKFPDPVALTQRLTEQYDVGLSFDLTTVPDSMKTLLVTLLKTTGQAELQRKDGEPEGAYRVRRANGESTLAFLELLLTECEAMDLGLKASREERRAVFDLNLRATPDSTFAEYLTDLAGRQSYFVGLLRESAPFSLSVSWFMDDREQKTLLEVLEAAEAAIVTRLAEDERDTNPITALFESLKETAAARHLDFFVQFEGQASEKFVLIGGLRLENGNRAGAALRNLLLLLQENPDLESVELDAASHQGVTFHRIQGRTIRRRDQVVYGESPGLYVGCGARTLWFAVGGDDALSKLKEAIDVVLQDLASPSDRAPVPPFQIVSNISQWFGLDDEAELTPRRELALEAFGLGEDRLQLDFQPTDEGARLRLRLDEGFLRFLGLAMARRYDRSQL